MEKLLTQYETDAVQKVNSYIGRLLSLYSNDLHIRKKKGTKVKQKCACLYFACAFLGENKINQLTSDLK